MGTETTYAMIGHDMFDRVFNLLLQHRHVSILGPRQCAKAYILQALQEMTADVPESTRPLVARLVWDSFSHVDERQFLRMFCRALRVPPVSRGYRGTPLSDRIVYVVEQAVKAESRPVWIFVQDVLGMPLAIARQLLEGLRIIWNEPRLRERTAAVVTGSSDFVPLTYGPDSPYRHSQKLIVSRMDRHLAEDFFCERRARHRGKPSQEGGRALRNPRDEITSKAFNWLYQQTSGNPHLLQELIASAARHPHDSHELNLRRKWQLGDVKRCIDRYIRLHVTHDHFLRTSLREAECDTEAFDLLVKVIESGKKGVAVEGKRPHQLEISGLLFVDDAGVAHLSSPVIEAFVRRVVTPRRIGDVYASQGRWDKAWKQYDAVPEGMRDRPVSGPPRFRLREATRDWEAHLLDKAYQSVESVVRHFFDGARHLLGFDCGGFYDHRSGRWTPYTFGHCPDRPLADRPQSPESARSEERQFWLSSDRHSLWSEPKITSRLPERPDPALFMARSGFGREIDITHAQIVKQSLDRFWGAYSVAQEVEHRKRIGELWDGFRAVIDVVNSELVRDNSDMGMLIKKTARALVEKAGYYRSLIALVDPTGQRIQGVGTWCVDSSNVFPLDTDFPLYPPVESVDRLDVLPWVVRTGRSASISDAREPGHTNPAVNDRQARNRGIVGFAVAPIVAKRGDVIGAIHVERKDKAEPTPDEVEVLQAFATQIAVVFRLAQRLTLLQGAMNAVSDKIRVVDPRRRVLFANTKAARQHAVPKGSWIPHMPACVCERQDSGAPQPCLIDELSDDASVGHYVAEGESVCQWEMARITDFRSRLHIGGNKQSGTIGYAERVHDLTSFYSVHLALRFWQEADTVSDTIDRIVVWFSERGYRWVRLYLVQAVGNGTVLRGIKQYGLRDAKHVQRFEDGRIVYYKEDGGQPWHVVLEAKDVVIYEHDPSIPRLEVLPGVPLRGFPVFRTNDVRNRSVLEKRGKREDRWIEAPLSVEDETLGKLTLSMPHLDEMGPQRWELLRLAINCAALALDRAFRTERLKQMDLRYWQARANTADEIFHDLKSPLATCRLYVENLAKRAGESDPELDDLYRSISESLSQMERVARDFARNLREYVPSIEKGDILERIRSIRKAFIRENAGVTVEIHTCKECCEVITDIDFVGNAIHEMLTNALAARASSITIRVRQGKDDSLTEIDVEDNGDGVLDAMVPYIFSPRSFGKRPGHGLGLPMIAAKLKVLGGSIEHTKSPSGRTCFLLKFPKDTRMPQH